MVLDTERLAMRPLRDGDAPFILELLNDPDWIRFIGDRNVRTLDDARGYIGRVLESQEKFGFSLLHTALRDGTPAGLCGLIKRDTFQYVDLGFAFLPAFRGKGYAAEAGAAVRDYGIEVLGLPRLVAFTDPENQASCRLLERLGFAFEGLIPWDADGSLSTLYGYEPSP
jgi:RimJ/RimL family protein N-acetyltransferase